MKRIGLLLLVCCLLVCALVLTSVQARQKAAYPLVYAACNGGSFGFSTNTYLVLGPPNCSPDSSPNSGAPFGVIMPSSGTLSNLHAAYGGGGYGYNASFTVYVNGLSTSLTCTASGGGVCSDDSHDVDVDEGDVVNFELNTSSNVSSGPALSVSVEKQ